MTASNVFKRRTLPPSQVAEAQAAAAGSPITGDPRIPAQSTELPAPTQPAISSAKDVQYSVGNVYDVPLEKIRSNPLNPRVVYTSQAVDEMALTLTQSGQRVAATAYLDDGHVTLIEGETRLRGARAGGLKTIRVEIQATPASKRELYKFARDANVRRREQTPLDDALKWKELLAEKVFDNQAQLSEILDVPESTVSRTLQLATLPKRVITSLSDHPSLLSFQMLNALREYCQGYGEDKTLDYLPLIEKNGWGYRQVAKDAAKASTGPVRRKRGDTEPIEYGGGKGEIKVFDGGSRLEVSLKGVEPKLAPEMVDKLKEFFAQQLTLRG